MSDQTNTTAPLTYRFSPARTVMRMTFLLDITGPAPANTVACQDEPGHTFEANSITVEISARHQQVMHVLIQGSLIIKTGDGLIVSTWPRAANFWHIGGSLGQHLADLPDWIRPILDEAQARTREAFL